MILESNGYGVIMRALRRSSPSKPVTVMILESSSCGVR
jgi:hypothetical protein